ncbi:carbamoyltransferase HypF [Acidobacteriota bacterium]
MTEFSSKAINIQVFGVVQGVGFRPFIFRLAEKLGYTGWVKNIGFGVLIHLENQEASDFRDFLDQLHATKPPLSQIEELSFEEADFSGASEFIIQKTEQGESFVFISPDISVCDSCHSEMLTPSDRRYGYPFINCTDCGPRYTIVTDLPYDRKQTTMKRFPMCPDCTREYDNPRDRRFHAQPVACPVCGPHVELYEAKSGIKEEGGIKRAAELIRNGSIVAVKGLGGFHLTCSASDPEAVLCLRNVKSRQRKPFALMAKNIQTVEKYASITSEERELLLSARRPIVLVKKKKEVAHIAPHLEELGFMLPYTPLHHLLLEDIDLIVATSANKKDSPIMKDEEEGIRDLCDFFLTHNRPIYTRADDSVLKVVDGIPLFVRRARGYVPYPQRVPEELFVSDHILALGGELKDTLSIYKNGYVVTSQFLGDLDEYQNFQYFEETIKNLTRLFKVEPRCVVSDLHPDFHTTRYAQKMGIPHIQVQHHYAHVLAPLLEHGIPPGKTALGVVLDGYGFGGDGEAWGGEFLLFDYDRYQRFAHFDTVPLPGGDLAAKQPWRMALSYLWKSFDGVVPRLPELQAVPPNIKKGIIQMIEQGINSPSTSSCGRLFDAVSYLSGLSPMEVEYEAEAPMRLETSGDRTIQEAYPFELLETTVPFRISFRKTFQAIASESHDKGRASRISSKFHNTLAAVIRELAHRAKKIQQIDTVVLGGGVFLNGLLLEKTQTLLQKDGFRVLRPTQYSPNDESISVGQIAHALYQIKKSAG